MDQEKPERPGEIKTDQNDDKIEEKAIKYGDVLDVKGDLADEKVAPADAAMMQSAESKMFGEVEKGGPASLLQSAANKNEKAGFVGHNDVTCQGVTVSDTHLPGKRIIKELIGGQVSSVHKYTFESQL